MLGCQGHTRAYISIVSSCLDLPVFDKQQLEVICCRVHLAALFQSLEASLHGYERLKDRRKANSKENISD